MSILNLGTYPPKQCGIATFSMDLRQSLLVNGEGVNIMAISDSAYHYDYPPEVVFNLEQDARQDYAQAASFANSNSDIDLVVIQHEYGIFGGPDGEYVWDFARLLRKPYVLVTHTVLPKPSRQQKLILNKLGQKAAAVICMTTRSGCLLSDLYGIANDKVHVVPHGVPEFTKNPAAILKSKFNLTGRQVISTFGLIGPGKGLELGLRAIKDVIKDYREVCYLILGQTHPMLKKSEGESYRHMLEEMVVSLGLENHVRFVNKYLTDNELGEYLYMTDIYLSPYPDKNQAVSGTMAFAVGCGRAVVSTSYAYALETLSGGRGLLAKNPDPAEMALLIKAILSNSSLKAELQQKAGELGGSWSWPCIGKQYRDLFLQIRSGSVRKEAKQVNYGGF
ncbi:MAG TPA: glycosyltransferase family 4 protein [Syntrophomonadaceae bacterium]|nr:glycosyltransferase family 4 protein [Syntrophomonadaceae bacterium]